MPYRSITGMHDLLPEEADRWRSIEGLVRALFPRHGYREIRTPLLEETALFVRSVGTGTDIVDKEMYVFGEGNESQALRPEGTAGVFRAYLEKNLHKSAPFQKFYYVGPFFRRERPQKGRLRQFHQIGIEAIGSTAPLLDVETILLGDTFFREGLGLENFTTRINSIGCPDCRGPYLDRLAEAVRPHAEKLCGNCKTRLERNRLRLFDCKVDVCREVLADAPKIAEALCDACRDHHAAVLDALAARGGRFEEDARLVRGLDYYTHTVFEYRHRGIGARDAIGGGGRYDGLAEQLDGPATGAVGFALGFETTVLAMESEKRPDPEIPVPPSRRVFVVAIDDACRRPAWELAMDLRAAGAESEVDYAARSPNAQMRRANREGYDTVCILGPDELAADEVTVKSMTDGTERKVALRGEASSIA